MILFFAKIRTFLIGTLIPIGSFIISIISIRLTLKNRKTINRIQELELIQREYEVQKIKQATSSKYKPDITTKVVKTSSSKYYLRVSNLSDAKAYNINISVPKEYDIDLYDYVLPLEYLESRDNFDLPLGVTLGSNLKFNVHIAWEDGEGHLFTKEELKIF